MLFFKKHFDPDGVEIDLWDRFADWWSPKWSRFAEWHERYISRIGGIAAVLILAFTPFGAQHLPVWQFPLAALGTYVLSGFVVHHVFFLTIFGLGWISLTMMNREMGGKPPIANIVVGALSAIVMLAVGIVERTLWCIPLALVAFAFLSGDARWRMRWAMIGAAVAAGLWHLWEPLFGTFTGIVIFYALSVGEGLLSLSQES